MRLPRNAELNDPKARADTITQICAISDDEEKSALLLQLSDLLAQEWLLVEAEQTIDLVGGCPKESSDAYLHLAVKFSETGQREHWRSILMKARTVVGTMKVPWQAAESLCRIARSQWRNGHLKEARADWELAVNLARQGELSSSTQDRVDSSSVLWEISVDLALTGDLGAALELAQSIQDSGKRERSRQQIENIAAMRKV